MREFDCICGWIFEIVQWVERGGREREREREIQGKINEKDLISGNFIIFGLLVLFNCRKIDMINRQRERQKQTDREKKRKRERMGGQ